jgi:hypothetical protein
MRFFGPSTVILLSMKRVPEKYCQNILPLRLREKVFWNTDDGSIFGLTTEHLRRFHAGACSATRSKPVD